MEKEVFVVFENPMYNYSWIASSGFSSAEIKKDIGKECYVDKLGTKCKIVDIKIC